MLFPNLKYYIMENNIENQMQEEEIPNVEQFQVGRVADEEVQSLSNSQQQADEDDVQLGFLNEEPEGEYVEDPEEEDIEEEQSAEDGEDDAEFENPDDDPA